MVSLLLPGLSSSVPGRVLWAHVWKVLKVMLPPGVHRAPEDLEMPWRQHPALPSHRPDRQLLGAGSGVYILWEGMGGCCPLRLVSSLLCFLRPPRGVVPSR